MKRTVISIFTIAALGGALLFVAFSIAFPGGDPSVASAQTTGTTAQQLQAEIQALNAQITALQARLGGVPSTPSTAGGFPATGSTGVGYAFTPGTGATSTVLLQINVNPALMSGTIVPGSADQHIASFIVTNTSSGTVTLPAANGIGINPGANSGVYLAVRAVVNGTLYGTQGGLIAATGSTAIAPIAGTQPVTIAPGAQAMIDLYADVSATAPLGLANTASLQLSVPNELTSSVVKGQTMTIGTTANTSTTSSGGGPVIVSISPTGGNAGAAVTITGSGFGATTTVFMNGELAARTASVRSSSTVSFIVPISLTPDCTAQSSTAANGSTTATFACTGTAHLEGPGTYEITVGVNGVMSNAMPFQLTGNSYYNTP